MSQETSCAHARHNDNRTLGLAQLTTPPTLAGQGAEYARYTRGWRTPRPGSVS